MAAGGPGCQRQVSADDGLAEAAREAPSPGPAGDQSPQKRAAAQGKGYGGDGGLADAAKKVGDLLFGGHGRLTSATHRRKAIELIDEVNAAGAGAPVAGIKPKSVDQQANRGAQSDLGDTINSGRLSGSRGVTSFLKATEN